jgi:hypothetical protein
VKSCLGEASIRTPRIRHNGYWLRMICAIIGLSVSGTPSLAGNSAKLGDLTGPGHRYITLDQFGYRPADPKVAVLTDPQVGFNASDSFEPGNVYEVRRASDHRVVFTGPVLPHNDGKVQTSSGDRGYWFDFSQVQTPGTYYLFDTANKVRSHTFDIREDVYRDVLAAAVRMFFYNRAGAEKAPPYADPRWADAPAFLGPRQDTEARAVGAKNDPTTARDLRGGWFDAGDTNKYVNNAGQTLHQLLAAYRERPEIWTDDLNIPESGNGRPDLIDEIIWELDWLKRMQQADGGVLIKVGFVDRARRSPPSRDPRPRYYAPVCSSSTISTAGVFAHAATILRDMPGLADYARDLLTRANRAWVWYHANPKRDDCDTQEVKSGDDDRSVKRQAQEEVVAAIYLYSATSRPEFATFVQMNYRRLQPYNDIGWSRYRPHQGEALLYFTTLKGIDEKLRQKILQKKREQVNDKRSRSVYQAGLTIDLYRSYIADSAYHWGSNKVRSNYANSNLDLMTYGLAADGKKAIEARALGHLHYLHGTNPMGLVYLSNMGKYGAERSLTEIFHYWFDRGTPWHSTETSPIGPAPGYLVGGPNARYSGPASPPAGQPLQKSYRDWHGPSKERSWEMAEPHIVYQAAYIKLLSKFVGQPKLQE